MLRLFVVCFLVVSSSVNGALAGVPIESPYLFIERLKRAVESASWKEVLGLMENDRFARLQNDECANRFVFGRPTNCTWPDDLITLYDALRDDPRILILASYSEIQKQLVLQIILVPQSSYSTFELKFDFGYVRKREFYDFLVCPVVYDEGWKLKNLCYLDTGGYFEADSG